MAKATEQEKELMKKYHQKNKEKIHLRKHSHYLKNREKILEKQKLWKNKNCIRTTLTSNVSPVIKIRARKYAMKHQKLECGICKSKENLENHHWNYNKPYKNTFAVLCSTCHDIQHVKNFYSSKFRGGF